MPRRRRVRFWQHPTWALVPAAPLLLQLRPNVPGTAAEDRQSPSAPSALRESQWERPAPGFGVPALTIAGVWGVDQQAEDGALSVTFILSL